MSALRREDADATVPPTVLSPPRRVPFAKAEITAEAREAVARVLSSGWVTSGPEVAEFEKEFAAFIGVEHAVAVSSCTAAIELALRALRLPSGAKVLTSTMTFCGAVNAIVHAGLRPVLVDVEPETLMPTPSTVAEATRLAGGADAMVVLHFGGYPASVEMLSEAAGLPLDRVIEDAAHALDTWVDDRPVGSISAATCFSFYATKNLPIGEGGMITTSDPDLAEYVRRARLHGMSRDAWRRYMPGSAWRYSVEIPGLKANMTDVQAAIGRAHLQRFPTWQDRRTEIVRRYDARLADIAGLKTPAWPPNGRHAWHLYVLRVQQAFGMDRDAFMASLAEHGVDCSVHFIPVHHQPHFVRLLGDDVRRRYPVADAAFYELVSLPLHPGLTDEDVDYVCDVIATVGASAPRSPGVTSNGSGDPPAGARCLILGAGQPGRTIESELRPVAEFGLSVVGFLDDGPGRKKVAGLPVLGKTEELPRVVREHAVDVVIVALPSLPRRQIVRLAEEAAAVGASVRYLPASADGIVRIPRIGDLRPLRPNGGQRGKPNGDRNGKRRPGQGRSVGPTPGSSVDGGSATRGGKS